MALTCLALLAGCADTSPSVGPKAASPTEPFDYGVWDSPGPPPLKLSSGRTTVIATQGSSCWGNACSDAVAPRAADLPKIGPASTLDAGFPVSGNWEVRISDGMGFGGCGHYPVRVEADGAGHLELTPSGPAGERVGWYFVYAGSGDTSGWWRWTVPPRDGLPLAWVHVNQNSPSSGGMTDLKLLLDDADVDGEVSAKITVGAADGAVATFAMSEVDQHCPNDGFVELAIPSDTPEPKIDGLGPTPYKYEVTVGIGGETYAGTGTWSGEGTEYGGDAPLTFEPPLPAPR